MNLGATFEKNWFVRYDFNQNCKECFSPTPDGVRLRQYTNTALSSTMKLCIIFKQSLFVRYVRYNFNQNCKIMCLPLAPGHCL